VTVRVIPGPQLESFSSAGIQTFLKSPYQIITESDRMGYRLEGPVIEHITSADIISEGMALGSIQVPANGQPIIMLSDRQTVGGYTKIATIILADTPLIAQCPIGSGLVRFQTTTLEIARQSYLERISALEMGIEETEDT
jgi:allophanate hydrolase subunit 2